MRITLPHISYIPASPLTFPYALAPSTPKGDFATADHGAHAAHARRQALPPNDFLHPDEIPQWLAAFIHPNFQV